ncbi:GDSL-type esterase/lipase family protein [Longispora sp. K20-0274]|uniref:GDSL-type esterase/lipase family protein n=1 Tax=Longispora sp. K20-0274 TaxID=3088255 RepID=UPI00399A1C06
MRSTRFLVVLAAAVTMAVAAPAAAYATPAAPTSIASLGDSITRGFNACGWYSDCTRRSWSTGIDGYIESHYDRIDTVNPDIDGNWFNDAKTGAKMADLNGQAGSAVAQGAGYVTILMGANDACTSSESAMTPVATYRAQLDAALATLKSGVPNSPVFVASVPDVKRLWQVGKDSGSARTAWSTFGICQSLLANPTSTAAADVARRDRVRQRVADYNAQLAQACAAYGSLCRFDGNAVFNYPFQLSQVSTWDYFHPNAEGQRVLAETTYAAGFGW